MNILLVSFSGTGNTFLCGNDVKKNLEEQGHNVTHYRYSFDNEFNFDFSSYDMVGIGYPIHAFNIAKPFYKFLKSFPKLEKKMPYFIYKVSGEPFHFNDASSIKIVRLLKKKNFDLISEKHFLMPYNIVFRYKDEIAKQMYLYLEPLTELFVDQLFSDNDKAIIKYKFWHKAISFVFRIEWIAPSVNKFFVHSKKKLCTKCDVCIKNCPTHSLYKNKKGVIKTKGSCALCMRCSYNCPKNAMNMGILNLWVVNGPYKYEALAKDNSLTSSYINKNTKGYFKKFRKYFTLQNQLLTKYNIPIPSTYEEGSELI